MEKRRIINALYFKQYKNMKICDTYVMATKIFFTQVLTEE
jgi:hypothetical protein